MHIAPLTIASQIKEHLSELFCQVHHYLPEDDVRLREISRDIDKLASKRADQSSLLKAQYTVLLGDREQAEYWLRNAVALGADRYQLELARLIIYVNLGFFSEALSALRYVGDPATGFASNLLSESPSTGAFKLYAAMFDKANQMNILDFPVRPSTITDAVAAMDFWGESDEDYSAALDVAGEVLRSKKLLMVDAGVRSEVYHPKDGSPAIVRMSMRLNSDFDTCLDMTAEYTDRLASSRLKIPQSLIFEFVPEAE